MSDEILNLLQSLVAKVDNLTTEVQEIKTDQQDLKLRVGGIENNMVYFATRLQSLEEKVEARLHDTRPIWQAVLERLTTIESDLVSLKSDMTVVKSDIDFLKQGQERIEKQFLDFRQDVLNRLDKLEDQKHYIDFLTLKGARMQMEINELKADVALLQQK